MYIFFKCTIKKLFNYFPIIVYKITFVIEIHQLYSLWSKGKRGRTLYRRDKNILPAELPKDFALPIKA